MKSSEWKALLDDEPDNELIHFSFAKALMDERSWEASASEFEKLIEADPEYVIAYAFLARCYLEAGKEDKARDVAERGLPLAKAFNHDVPIEELESVLEELDSEF